jgi:hypothetical protein
MSSSNETDSIFEYEIIIPETTAKITLTKETVVKNIENNIGRSLTEKEGISVWNKIKCSDDFYGIFPEYARSNGINYHGASDYQLYCDSFEQDVKKGIQDSVDGVFSNLWDNFLERALDDIASELETKKNVEEITWDNIESQTQERIQDENVKNGLARCAKELKKTSIKKWREHYVNTHIIDSSVTLPNGKNKDDLVKNIITYLT